MNQKEFEEYTGNLRIKSICFDTLAQMWEGANDEYDPKVEQPAALFYIGKIGKYDTCSYITNDYLRCSSINVKFANGYVVMVTPNDVEATEEEITWEEFLPKIDKVDKDETFTDLTKEEMEFADKAVLQMLVNNNTDFRKLMDRAIGLAIYRSDCYYNAEWNKNCDAD